MSFNRYFLLLFTLVIISCDAEKDEPILTTELSLNASDITSVEVLGRVLFYDKRLSINSSVSCASCHKQQFAFADNVALSRGFENRLTDRNSMPLQNLSSSFRFDAFSQIAGSVLFWDGRETNLSDMVLKPIVNHKEMGIKDIEWLENRISGIDLYKESFKNVFFKEEIDINTVGTALAAFVGSISSNNTKLDQVMSGRDQLTGMEAYGQDLFFEKYNCNSCHQVQSPDGYLFAGTFANVGLDPVYNDEGLGAITGLSEDIGKFKIPSLRNVTLTAPYMHDGRFATLDEVMDHYSTGMTNNENLDFRLKNEAGNPLFLSISEQEKEGIIAFLNTLTDYSMITNPDFSNPFVTSK